MSSTPKVTLPLPRTRNLTGDERRAVAVFAMIVTTPVIVLVAPFWVADLDSGLLSALTPLAMVLPALAALVGSRRLRRRLPVRYRLAVVPLRPVTRLVAAFLLTFLGLSLLAALTLAAADLLGIVRVNLAALSDPRDRGTALALPFIALAYLLLTTGEELGWRGFAQTTLAPLGFWRASFAISTFWALWHLPLTITHVRLGSMAWQEALGVTGNLILSGAVLSGLRALTGSVWPAAYGHAVLNTVLVFAYSRFIPPSSPGSSHDLDFIAVGWCGWGLALGAVAVLVHRLARRHEGLYETASWTWDSLDSRPEGKTIT